MIKKISCLLFLVFCLSSAQAQGSTFIFTNAGTTAQMDTALNYTGRIWGKFLNSTIPIKVNIYYTNLGSASNLAITIPNGRRDFTNSPLDSIWYASSLANSLALAELNPGESDMDIYVNSNVNWYLDTLGNPVAGQYDFVTVILHEMGHGLAFLSLAKIETGLGSFGLVDAGDILPLVASFPFPDLQGKPSSFAYYMENVSGQSLIDTTIFQNNSASLETQFTSNSVYFDGPISLAQNGGTRIRLYAPSTYASGSSMQHLNESTFPASDPNSLMTPFINTQEVHHHPGDLTIAMMEDMGWNVNYIQNTDEEIEHIHFTFFPNPANENVLIYPQTGQATISLIDLQGRVVDQFEIDSNAPVNLNVSELERGCYLLEITSENHHSTAKLILE